MTAQTLSTKIGKLETIYGQMVAGGKIERDPAQLALVQCLDALLVQVSSKRLSSKSSALGWLFGSKNEPSETRNGLYIWGDVGRGKSMLMDLFFENLPHKRKRRSHFNDFMQDAQERIHAHREAFKAGTAREEDPIAAVGREMAQENPVLCFDEFTVTDIADAMILGRLFGVLFEERVVVVATSNVKPANLYRDGLNRQLFLPFIDMLEDNVEVFQLDARTDFRLEKLTKSAVYHQPLGETSTSKMQEIWQRMTGMESGKLHRIDLKGRVLDVPEYSAGVARISFSQLCEEPRSAEDYLALARLIHTLFITDVPVIEKENRNVAKRFILLIDTLYDNHVRILMSAATEPELLYGAKQGTEAFEFKRTVSRLHEMQSVEYMGS